MIRIDSKDWLENFFALSKRDSDILNTPFEKYAQLIELEKEKIRQTQIFENEIVKVLGAVEQFYLIMKFDKTLGWIEKDRIELSSEHTDFIVTDKFNNQSAQNFLNEWHGVNYLFGGISKNGIDCSGFTQKYFLEVLGKIIPKNSKDQRKLAEPKDIENIKNNDLIFCHRKGSNLHHVVLFFEIFFWHARPTYGVVSQSLDDFTKQFEIECVAEIRKDYSFF